MMPVPSLVVSVRLSSTSSGSPDVVGEVVQLDDVVGAGSVVMRCAARSSRMA